MPNYLFQLGHQPHISRAEIVSVLEAMNISYKLKEADNNYLLAACEEPVDTMMLNQTLGGTVKIMEKISTSKDFTADLVNYLNRIIPEGKINFSLSGPNANRLAIAIKKELKHIDRTVRYIEPKNTATILHNDLIKTQSDLTIVYTSVYVTRAIQLIEEFTERDYGRPHSDNKSGMLPPKLARIMINLAGISEINRGQATILDPFCGSGTILIEATDLGFFNIIGNDLAQKAIDDTAKNVDWYVQKNKLKANPKFILSSAQGLRQKLQPKSVDFIVSEPYMGNPLRGNETKDQLIKSTRELKKLYEDTFRTFSEILKPDGTIIFIIPEFYINNEIFTIDCLSFIRKLGFKSVALDPESDSLLYRRSGQFVGRRIWKFRLS